jgi:mannosyltransferase OCH1-like enzyme
VLLTLTTVIAVYIHAKRKIQNLQKLIKTVHFIYGLWDNSNTIPAKYRQCQEQWHRKYPDWTIRTWTKDQAQGLIQHAAAPKLKEAFYKASPLQKLHLLRYFILYQFGGVYADMDAYPGETSLQVLLLLPNPSPTCVLFMKHSSKPILSHFCLVSSVPKHPLFAQCLNLICQDVSIDHYATLETALSEMSRTGVLVLGPDETSEFVMLEK